MATEVAKTKSLAHDAELAADKVKKLDASVKSLSAAKDHASKEVEEDVIQSKLKDQAAIAAKDEADQAVANEKKENMKKEEIQAKLKEVTDKKAQADEDQKQAQSKDKAAAAEEHKLGEIADAAKAKLDVLKGQEVSAEKIAKDTMEQASAAVDAKDEAIQDVTISTKALIDAKAAEKNDKAQLHKRHAQLNDISQHPVVRAIAKSE